MIESRDGDRAAFLGYFGGSLVEKDRGRIVE